MKYIIIIALLFPTITFGAAWTDEMHIDSIRIHPHYLAIHFPSNIPAPDSSSSGCSNTDVISINRNSAIFSEALSTILAAKMGNKKVKFYIDGCNNSYMNAHVIWLQ